tara:strand:- start:375 stop:599 length:225 start_codon:yes stop_codon:yes gene_type:complete
LALRINLKKQKKEFIKSVPNLERRKNVDVLELGERQEKLRELRENIEEIHVELGPGGEEPGGILGEEPGIRGEI